MPGEWQGLTELRRRRNGDTGTADITPQPALAADAAAFLSQAARTLASSLDYEETLKLVARLAVPVIADWCVIDIVDQELNSGLRRLAITHVDPDKERLGHEIARRYPPLPGQLIGPGHVARTGRSELVEDIPDSMLVSVARDDEHLVLLRRIGFSSYMCVPLRARGTVLGAITCVTADSGRRFGSSDLELLEDLARSAASAVDNAVLLRDAEEARSATEEALGLLDALFESASVGLGFWDPELRYVRINDCLAGINGVAVEACLGRTPADVLGPLGEEIEVLFRSVLDSREPIVNQELAGHTAAAPDEQRYWVVNYFPVLSSTDAVLGVGAVVVDVTERNQAEEALRHSEDLFRSLVENATDYAIYMLDPEGKVMSWNRGAEKAKGYSREEIVGRHFSVFFTTEDIEQKTPERHLKLALERGSWEHQGWRVRKDGSRFWANTVLTALRDASGRVRGFSKVSRDMSEAKALEDQLKRQALTDPLTSLANRALFRDRVDHAFARRERRDEGLAVLFVDLDGFKKVNDTLGHDAGDHLLVEVAARLHDCVRPSDTAARMGGDEFAILLDDLKSPSDAARVAERILGALSAPYEVADGQVRVQASIGLVANPAGQSGEEAVRNADLAMYSAKQAGKGRYELFEPGMHTAAVKRLKLEAELRQAVEDEGFELHYQPIVELETRRIAGVEALLRWHHPTDGLLAPSTFMDVAEETGLILPIGSWVLRQACAQGAWVQSQDPMEPPLSMSVNLSPKQFHHSGLVEDVARALEESSLPAQSLILEVTEATLLEGGEESITKLEGLKDMGVRLALDDFGTGYSSLTHLRRFPVDILSLDKKFVEGLRRGSSEWAFAGAIVSLCETLDLDTLAEGIERGDQLAKLKALGCDEGQGYYLRRPLGLEETLELVKSSESSSHVSPAKTSKGS